MRRIVGPTGLLVFVILFPSSPSSQQLGHTLYVNNTDSPWICPRCFARHPRFYGCRPVIALLYKRHRRNRSSFSGRFSPTGFILNACHWAAFDPALPMRYGDNNRGQA